MNRHEQALAILHEGTVIPATPLALRADRTFDEKRQRALIRYYLAAGSGGIAIGVHTTQFEIRDPQFNLYEPVLRVALEEMTRYEEKTGKVIVRVAGVCGKTEQAVAEAKLARDMGFDAVLLSPGGLNDLPEEEMLERTAAVASVLPVIGFYLQTAVGGRRFSFDYWCKLCDTPGVVAIKAAPFNRYQTLDVARAAALSSRGDEIALYTGNDDNIVIDLLTEYKFEVEGKTYTRRFVGGLLGHWSVWTKSAVELYHRLRKAAEAGEITPELLTEAAAVTDMNAVFFDVANNFKGCICGLHEVLRRQGLMEGTWCLLDDGVVEKEQLDGIDRLYRMYPQWNDDAFIKAHLEEWLAD